MRFRACCLSCGKLLPNRWGRCMHMFTLRAQILFTEGLLENYAYKSPFVLRDATDNSVTKTCVFFSSVKKCYSVSFSYSNEQLVLYISAWSIENDPRKYLLALAKKCLKLFYVFSDSSFFLQSFK